jgi:hypothetical protein
MELTSKISFTFYREVKAEIFEKWQHPSEAVATVKRSVKNESWNRNCRMIG